MTAMRLMGDVALWCLSIGAVAGCQPQAASTFVDRADIELAVASDGSIEVFEQFEVRVEASPAVFERTVDHARVDGLAFVGATLNGDELVPGGGDDLTVRDGHMLRVRWKLPPGQTGTRHRVTLGYRAVGAVFVSGALGRLEWPALPAGRTFAVDAARVVLHLPGKPSADLVGMVQSGWQVTTTTDAMMATATGIGLTPAVAVVEFPLARGPAGATRVVAMIPAWQVTADLRREFAPAFVSGALFMLVIGGGVVWMLHFKHSQPRPSSTTLPDDEERAAVAAGLRTSALAVGSLALICMSLAALFLPRFGWWGQVIPVSIAMVAGLFYVSAGRFR